MNLLSLREMQWIRKIADGQVDDLQPFFQTFLPSLVKTAWYFLGPSPDTPRVVREAVEQVLRDFPCVPASVTLENWFHHAVVWRSYRTWKEKKEKLQIFFREKPPFPHGGDARSREIFEAFFQENFHFEKTAARLNLPWGTLLYALERLQAGPSRNSPSLSAEHP